MNAVAYRLWLWFWQLLPANPILVRVVQGASKRTRHLWLRTGYLCALLVVVLALLAATMTAENSSLAQLAKGASRTFAMASYAQLAMMCLMAPMFTAAAITQERDAQTFNILLSTPLTNAQIVFGTLMSRLYFLLMLLVAGLPIFLMTMVYGGVTRSQVFESFALSGSTAVLTGALAIFVAMLGVGTRRTIFSFYLAIALFLTSVFLIGRWDDTWIAASPANIAGQQMSWLAPLHPFLALEVALNRIHAPPVSHLMGYSGLSKFALSQPAAAYVLWTLTTAFVLTVASVLFVRRGAKTGERTLWTALTGWIPGRNRGERTRPPRHVWSNPVAWREAKSRGSGGGVLRWSVIIGGLAASALVMIYYAGGSMPAAEVREWLAEIIIVQFAIALIIATNTAATSMTKEKESKTMDILLTTPLTSKYILWGKLRGLVSFAVPLMIGPAAVLVVFALYDMIRGGRGTAPAAVWIECAIEVVALMVIYTGVACVIGLRISLVSRKTVTAVMSSVGLLILLCGVASVIGFPLATNAGGRFGAFLAPFTPFTAIYFLVDPVGLYGDPKEFLTDAPALRTAAIFGTAIAAAIYAFIVYTVYAGLVRNFDMIVRKQSGTF